MSKFWGGGTQVRGGFPRFPPPLYESLNRYDSGKSNSKLIIYFTKEYSNTKSKILIHVNTMCFVWPMQLCEGVAQRS